MMNSNFGFIWQIIVGTKVTIVLALFATLLGLTVGVIGAILESIQNRYLRYLASSFILLIRGLPELLVLFFIYFGLTQLLSQLFNQYIEIDPFVAGVIALGLIFGAYASQVFRGAYLSIKRGQIHAAEALGFSKVSLFTRIILPQSLRHALPGLSNLWLVLLKDTAIVTLIGLSDMMNAAKMAAITTNQPFNYYLLAATIYLIITTISQIILNRISTYANRYTYHE